VKSQELFHFSLSGNLCYPKLQLNMPGLTTEPTLTFKRLHPTFAVEVEGIDWTKPIPPSVIKEIETAAAKEGVLVFRNANLDNEQHIAFSAQLGELDDILPHIKAGRLARFPDQPQIFDVSNLDHTGKILTSANAASLEANKGNFLWHADMAYNPRRCLFSIIRAVEIPPKGTGGETQFCDSRTAYDDLPQDLKDEIDGLVCNNSFFHNRKLGSPEYYKNLDPLSSPMSRHKLVVPHEGSGRKNLYFTTYLHHFDGMTAEESKPLYDRLMAHIQQEKYIVDVHYENNGDMVLWDNTAVLHRATTTGVYATKYKRDMRRTTVKDSGKYAWGENEVGVSWRVGLPVSFEQKPAEAPVQVS
jgi:alpha-ketoglutarate-dependent 2,4-dichlorophenoxyacetate dioxygenase